MKRSEISVPNPYQNYVNKASHEDLLTALSLNTKRFKKLLKNIPGKKVNYAYAEGKWTIKELLQHIIDAERVFVFRALWFSRLDPSPQPGFDENIWAANATVSGRKWKEMVDEFFLLRKSTEMMFASFTKEDLLKVGTASGNKVSVIAFGFIAAGHINHHIDIIEERYLSKNKKSKK